MGDGKLGWFRQFKDGQRNMHNEDCSGRPPIMNDDLVEKVDSKIRENRQFTISELRTCFSQISHTLLYEIVTERLHYHKVCA
jgi:hypothetical protein